MFIRKKETTIVLIDVANLQASATELCFYVDYEKLRNYFDERSTLLQIRYYTAYNPHQDRDLRKTRADYLAHHGFEVIEKVVKEQDRNGQTVFKGNVDVEIAADATALAYEFPQLGHIILFSGDGDFSYLVEKLRHKGIRVTVVSSFGHTSSELRQSASQFVDLRNLQSYTERDPE